MITRRGAMMALAGVTALASKSLQDVIGDIPGTALLVDIAARRPIAVHAPELASSLLAPPGSAIKPFTLEALLQAGKIKGDDVFPCPHNLRIGGREFDCSHPPMTAPIQVRTALAYSCNCFVAHFAQRLAPGELATHLNRCGLSTSTGWFGEREATGRIPRAGTPEAQQLQAIGESGVLVSAAAMAMAYRRLALSASEEIRRGLESAVEFGTAQNAGVARLKVAGKTGSVRAPDGNMMAWFCGFAPSRTPSVVAVVMLQGRSGGGDAAPVAGRILEAHVAGRI